MVGMKVSGGLLAGPALLDGWDHWAKEGAGGLVAAVYIRAGPQVHAGWNWMKRDLVLFFGKGILKY